MSEPATPTAPGSTRSREAAVLLCCIGGVVLYASRLGANYPLHDWLFWKIAALWAWCAMLSAACLAAGHVLLVRVLRVGAVPPLEMAVQSTALGLVVFVLGMYLAGFAHLYGAASAVTWPALMLVAGARPTLAWGVACWRSWRNGTMARSPEALLARAAGALGLVALVFVYLGAMTPEAINFDASWSHLPIAADYARAGRIVPFEGDYTRCFPHLASLVHTWAMTVPAWGLLTEMPLRWMLALHLEFLWFLWTLAGVGAVVAWLLERDHVGGAWAAFVLFPAIFVYDSNLGGAADHYLAFFAPPLFLAAMRCSSDPSPRSWIAAGSFAGAALLTKYQALYLIVGVGVVTAAVWASAAWTSTAPRPRSRWLAGPAALAGAFAVVVSPHFLKNWAFYGNPAYPFLQDVFPSYPTTHHAAYLFDRLFKDNAWRPHGTLLHVVLDSARLCFTWAFEPHYSFTRNVPDEGALFTLTLPLLLFIRSRRRIALAYVAGMASLFTWAMVFRVDRHLQTFMPLLEAATVALLVRAWELEWPARAGLVLLVSLQIVWGGDAPFYSGYARIASSIDLIRSGFEGLASQRFQGFRSVERAIGAALPPTARVVLHTYRPNLGIDRDLVLDWAGQQGLILYEDVHDPRGVFDLYRSVGATHLLWVPEHRPAPTLQEDVLFSDLVHRFRGKARRFGPEELVELPAEPPPPQRPYRVLSLGMTGYQDGLYPVEALRRYAAIEPGESVSAAEPLPADATMQADLAARADAVCVADGARIPAPLAERMTLFEVAATYPRAFTIRVRPRP